MKEKENGLAALLRTDGSAHSYYESLPYNIKEELINHQEEIRTLEQLRSFSAGQTE